jgi:phospholipid-binding lipoprotein MlaA
MNTFDTAYLSSGPFKLALQTRASLLEAEELITGDRYLFIRDAFLQRREFLVNDGVIEEDPFLDDME